MSRQYDEFLWRLGRERSITISTDLSPHDGENTGCEIIRTVMRLEYLGYRYPSRRRIPAPCVREIYSCGHVEESGLGTYNWRRPRKTGACFGCSRIAGLL